MTHPDCHADCSHLDELEETIKNLEKEINEYETANLSYRKWYREAEETIKELEKTINKLNGYIRELMSEKKRWLDDTLYFQNLANDREKKILELEARVKELYEELSLDESVILERGELRKARKKISELESRLETAQAYFPEIEDEDWDL